MNRDPEHWLLHREIVVLRSKGLSTSEIATKLDVTTAFVNKALREAIESIRERNSEVVEEMFLLHHTRLEELYKVVQRRIDECEVFDEKVLKVAIQILERQAKLLGLDKQKDKSHSPRDWLDTATPDQLFAEAERLGIEVPTRFRLTAPMVN